MNVASFPAALDTYSLAPKRDGYIVRLWVDVEHAAEVFKLNAAIERLVQVTFSKGGHLVPQAPHPLEDSEFFALLPAILLGDDD